MTTPDLTWVPTPAEVHGVMASRPIFTDSSKPTLEQVQGFIDRKALGLYAEIPALAARWFPVAKDYVIYATAALAEAAFAPEQAFPDQPSSRDYYDRMAGAELAKLRSAYDVPGDGTGSTGGVRGTVSSRKLRTAATTFDTDDVLPIA